MSKISAKVPVIFGSSIRQKLLCVLAMYGPQQLTFAFAAVGVQWLESWHSLERAGLIVSEKLWRKKRAIAIAHSFPARAALVRLLQHLATHYDLKKPRSSGWTSITQSKSGLQDIAPTVEMILGWSDRLFVFLALEALGGQSRLEELDKALPGTAGDTIRKNLEKFQKRGLLERIGNDPTWTVRFSQNSCCVPHLRIMLRRLLLTFPDIRQSASAARRELKRRVPYTTVGHLKWRNDVVRTARPKTYVPSITGAPLLFHSDARFRVLTALAHIGPLTALDLRHCADKPHEKVLEKLIRDGFVLDQGRYRDRTYALNTDFPAHTELKALLRKLWAMYPGVASLSHGRAWHLAERSLWTGDIKKLFGPKTRTLPLFNIAALGAVDGASLSRLVPQHDTGSLRMALAMYEEQGILKTHFEGTARMYSLNKSYGAHRELLSLLRKTIEVWPRYAMAASLEEPLMTPNRLKMRSNAQRRGAKNGSRRAA